MISVWLPPTYRLVPFNHGFHSRVIGVPTVVVRGGLRAIEDPTMIPQLQDVSNGGGIGRMGPSILVDLGNIRCRHPILGLVKWEQEMVVTLGSLGDLEKFTTTVDRAELGVSILIMLDEIEGLSTGLTGNLDSRPSNVLVRSLPCLWFDRNGYLS